MKQLFLLLILGTLGGCVTLSNRVACTVAGDEALYVSKYGQIGIASVIDERDTKILCKKP